MTQWDPRSRVPKRDASATWTTCTCSPTTCLLFPQDDLPASHPLLSYQARRLHYVPLYLLLQTTQGGSTVIPHHVGRALGVLSAQQQKGICLEIGTAQEPSPGPTEAQPNRKWEPSRAAQGCLGIDQAARCVARGHRSSSLQQRCSWRKHACGPGGLRAEGIPRPDLSSGDSPASFWASTAVA